MPRAYSWCGATAPVEDLFMQPRSRAVYDAGSSRKCAGTPGSKQTILARSITSANQHHLFFDVGFMPSALQGSFIGARRPPSARFTSASERSLRWRGPPRVVENICTFYRRSA
jgi:hypothetical protein